MDSVERNLRNHVHVLASEIGSRNILEPANLERAQRYIHERFVENGLNVKVQNFKARGNAAANLVASCPRSDLNSPLWVLGAHYDTILGTPGADDNASAVAVLLETARILCSRPGTPREVIFVAFSTEEPSCFNTHYRGSRVFVRRLENEKLRIRGAIVMEMVGYYRDEAGTQAIPLMVRWMGFPDRADFIAVVGNGRSRSLVKSLTGAIETSGCGLPVEDLTVPGSGHLLPAVRLSDNASFWDAGLPAVMVTDTSFFRNPHYHTHRDRPETLDFEKMAQLVKGVIHFFEVNWEEGIEERE